MNEEQFIKSKEMDCWIAVYSSIRSTSKYQAVEEANIAVLNFRHYFKLLNK